MAKRNAPSAEVPMVYGTVTVGDRGQVVIPKGARSDIGVHPGDKLLVLRMHKGGIALIKTDGLKDWVNKFLSQIK